MKRLRLAASALLTLASACGDDRAARPSPSSSAPSEALATPPPPPPRATPGAPGATQWSFDEAAKERAKASADARRVEALELLRGRSKVDALPELASDPGVKIETGLEARLLRPRGRALVTIGKLELVGQLERDEARTRIEQAHERFEDCYARTLAVRPTLRGSAIFKFTVAWEGNVDRVELPSSDLGDAWMEECLRRTIEGVRFDEVEGAGFAEQEAESAGQLVLQFDPG